MKSKTHGGKKGEGLVFRGSQCKESVRMRVCVCVCVCLQACIRSHKDFVVAMTFQHSAYINKIFFTSLHKCMCCNNYESRIRKTVLSTYYGSRIRKTVEYILWAWNCARKFIHVIC